jgi:hypothetical protein
VGGLTKGKKINKITHILLIFLLVVVALVLIFPKQILLSFLAETKKRVFRKFFLIKTYWIFAN